MKVGGHFPIYGSDPLDNFGLQLVSAHFHNLWLQIPTQILAIYMFLKCVTFSEKSPSVTSRKNRETPYEMSHHNETVV